MLFKKKDKPPGIDHRPPRTPFDCPKCSVSTRTLARLVKHFRNSHEQQEARIRRHMKEPMTPAEILEKMGY